MESRFQFRLGHLLWATYWVAALLVIWRAIGYVDASGPLPTGIHLYRTFATDIVVLFAAGSCWEFGWPKTGAVVGAVVGLLTVLALWQAR